MNNVEDFSVFDKFQNCRVLKERNGVFATNSDIQILIYDQPNVVDRRYFKQ